MKRSALLLCASALFGGCITDRILVDDGHGGLMADAAQFKRVEKETAARRHLTFEREVPADVMTVEQLRAWFDQYAEARKAELENEDRFFHRMNILPPKVSTAEAYKGFLADFVGGIYDDGSRRMILVSDYAWWAKAQQDAVGMITGVDWAYEVFLAHELTHALQDQHFGLGDMLKGGVYEDNDDAAFVRKTLLETEANVVGMSDFLGMDLEKLATRKAFFLFMRYNNLLNGPLLAALSGRTPSYFAKQSFSQYELGLSFVEGKLDEGGWDALSRAYVQVPGTPGGVPESTEQLLWPRKMRAATLDRPVPILRLEKPPAALPGSSLVVTNVFGALAYKHWLERLVGPLVGNAVADGWGGDRWDIIDDVSSGRHDSVLVWRTTWDSEKDAAELVDAYTDAVRVRYGERAHADAAAQTPTRRIFQIPAAPDEERFVRTAREERVCIEQRGKDVLILDGVRPEDLDALAAEMWAALVRVDTPPVDEARLAEKATALEQHIGGSVPMRAQHPDLLDRLFLPARTMAVRLGVGVGLDAAPQNGLDPLFLINDTEMRWGFRPHLEVSLPLQLAAEVRSFAGQTVVGVALRGLLPTPALSFSLGQAVALGDNLVVTGQGALEDVGRTSSVRAAAGALMRPFPALVLAPGIARTTLSVPGATDVPTVVIGSALRRGGLAQPWIELEVVEGLFVYEESAFFFDEKRTGLALRTQTHVMGLLLYF